MPLTFSVTLYGNSEHAEREAVLHLRAALDKAHTAHNTVEWFSAMLIGEANMSRAVVSNRKSSR